MKQELSEGTDFALNEFVEAVVEEFFEDAPQVGDKGTLHNNLKSDIEDFVNKTVWQIKHRLPDYD